MGQSFVVESARRSTICSRHSLFIQGWKVDTDIAKREQTTQGMIVAHEPANHNRSDYVFTANGKTFNSWAIPMKEELEIGRQVFVY